MTVGSNGKAYATGGSGSATKLFKSVTYPFTAWSSVTLTSTLSTAWVSGTNKMRSMSTFDGTNLIAVGGGAPNGGFILYSSNEGTTWTKFTGIAAMNIAVRPSNVYAVYCMSSTVAMVAGDFGYAAKTSDGGITWTILYPYGALNSTVTSKYRTVHMVDASNAYIVGCVGSPLVCALYKTADGGVTWSVPQRGFSDIVSLSMYNANYGTLGGNQGTGALAVADGRVNY